MKKTAPQATGHIDRCKCAACSPGTWSPHPIETQPKPSKPPGDDREGLRRIELAEHIQPAVVVPLRKCGHEVYDFKHPTPGNAGFSWKEIDGGWESWTPEQYKAALQHPIAVEGYRHDIEALRACDACVLVLPSGRSASWEFGYAMGQGKRGAVLQLDKAEPELMYREAEILISFNELLTWSGFP